MLQQATADSLVVIRVHNIKSAADKFGKFAQDAGIANVQPQAAEPFVDTFSCLPVGVLAENV